MRREAAQGTRRVGSMFKAYEGSVRKAERCGSAFKPGIHVPSDMLGFKARAIVGLLSLSLLSGCLDMSSLRLPKVEETGELFAASEAQASHTVLRKARLARGKIIVAPPAGYCVDGDSLKDRGAGFALVAPCSLLTARAQANDVLPALMTVATNRGKDLPTASELASELPDATIIDAIDGKGITLLHLDGAVPGIMANADSRHWRGVISVNGHLVALGLFAENGSPLTGKEGIVAISTLAENIRAQSPQATEEPLVVAQPATLEPAVQSESAPDQKTIGNPLAGVLARFKKISRSGG